MPSSLPAPLADMVDALAEQCEELCNIHDHSTRIIANLDINEDWFADYDHPKKARFDLVPMVKVFLYMYMGDLGQREMERRLRGAAYIYLRFDLDHPPQQQDISHNKRNRFTLDERLALKEAAERLCDICAAYDVVDVAESVEPEVEPDTVTRYSLPESKIRDAVKRAVNLGFTEFTDPRAANARYPLEVYFERQSYLNLSEIGTTSPQRRFRRLSNRAKVPSSSAHNNTLHTVAAPHPQRTLSEFTTAGDRKPEWQRIRDHLLEPFHAGVDNILSELGTSGADAPIRQPVTVAIDITTWQFWPHPFAKPQDATDEDERVTFTDQHGTTHTRIVRADHPEMVSGIKTDDGRAYKFATITVVMEDTPIVLGIEPVRDKRRWEADEDVPHRTSRDDIVDRLLAQASQHVDIHKVFLDRGFDSRQVRDVIDCRNNTYVLGKTNKAQLDNERIAELQAHDVYDSKIAYGTVTSDGRTHDVSYVYKPTDIDGEEYTIFTINEHVDHHRAEGLINQYANRMEIEVQYKTIKNNFLPTCASKHYEMRFLFFVIGVVMYNVWRLANVHLREVINADLGEDPPIQAGEIVELVAFFLFKHG